MDENADRRVALVTATPARGLDEDMPLLLRALGDAGLEPTEVVWDDPTVDWGGFDLAVVRSTWDYFSRREEFVAWAHRVAAQTALHNPPALLRWNSDKRYLQDLEQAGVTIVPTIFLIPGMAAALPPGEDLIVKPAVSAGSNDTARHRSGERPAAQEHLERLLAEGRVAMVQPYQSRVDEKGETALVYFDGRFSHAIEKGAIFASRPQMVGGLFAREEIRPRTPSAAELATGAAVLAVVASGGQAGPAPPLYARVDLVSLADGTPAVMELELCEPSVFLGHGAGAAERMAAAIVQRLEVAKPR